ncbi:hypothetical protein T190611E02C_10681 [Tenacibaculum sp. 190524A05c]|uniref:hypothetical protein n=1 Tax=Tenacibaculum platacis TaxID=3137852 RepID=UPI0031FB00E2
MERETLLDFYTIDELQVVKSDLIEHFKGINSVYVIDTFDVINYTLPFINKNSFDKDSKLALTTIFYENVFSIYKDYDIILANEYREELSNIVESFQMKITNFSSIRNKLLSFIEESISSTDKKINKEIFYNEFELIIVLYIFIEKGKNLFDRFNDFIESLNIHDFTSDKVKNGELIIDAFRNNQPTELTNNLLESFADSQKYKLASLDSDYERYCYLDNTYRDISVIDRIYNINNEIQEEKTRVKYLSSTPQKTGEIIKLLKKETKNTNCAFNRNINQVFLLKYLIEKSENEKESVDNINTLIDIKLVEKSISEEQKNASFLKSINNSLESFKKDLTNSYVFDSYSHYDVLFKSFLNKEDVSKADLLNIKKIIEKIDDNIPTKLLTDKLSSKLKFSQVLKLSHKLNDAINPSSIFINTGDDIIRNIFHHLPYLIFCGIENEPYIDEFYHFLNSITNSSEPVGASSKNFKKEIDRILSHLSYKKMTLSQQNIDFLILTFLNLVMETKSEHTDENQLIGLIESQVVILNNAKISFEKNEDKITVVKNNDKHIDDFNYMLLWLYRRTKQYKKSVQVINRNPAYKNSYRFIHGLALTEHAKAYDYIDKEEFSLAVKYLQKSKHLLTVAFERYQEVVFTNKNLRKLILKQKVGILNTYIDANLRIIEVTNTPNHQSLKESRDQLNIIKKSIELELPQIDYETLETINHTESELEYYEALLHFENENYLDSITKLNYTVDRLKIVTKSKTLLEDRFKGIEKKVNSLRYKNLVALKII